MYNHDHDTRQRDRRSSDNQQRNERNQSSAFAWRNDLWRPDHDWRERNEAFDASRRKSTRFDWSQDQRELISSDRVEGTPVYDRNGDNLGSIHNFMVEKRGGRVAYAVMKCSKGFLGLDQSYFPLDWSELDYDEDLHGYRVNLTERDLDRRQSFDAHGCPINSDGSYEQQNERR